MVIVFVPYLPLYSYLYLLVPLCGQLVNQHMRSDRPSLLQIFLKPRIDPETMEWTLIANPIQWGRCGTSGTERPWVFILRRQAA